MSRFTRRDYVRAMETFHGHRLLCPNCTGRHVAGECRTWRDWDRKAEAYLRETAAPESENQS